MLKKFAEDISEFLAKISVTFEELKAIAKQSRVGPSGSDALQSQTWLHKMMQEAALIG